MFEGRCLAPTCTDDVTNQEESDIDCGGPCDSCLAGAACLAFADCQSGVCDDGRCQAPTCIDRVRNGIETDVDCAGGCGPCSIGSRCVVGSDCFTGVCSNERCASPTCNDGVRNGDETDIDCSGACAACVDGRECVDAADCESRVCALTPGGPKRCAVPTCDDQVLNGLESDVDCGGQTCAPCEPGSACRLHGDCRSNHCDAGECAAAGCNDMIRNRDETDVDCGGVFCDACRPGQGCAGGTDCDSQVCGNSLCQSPRCDDGVENGSETDDDCGGAVCNACDHGRTCVEASDCRSRVCVENLCQVPACDDNVTNGTESDLDCGGECDPCFDGRSCVNNSDCVSGVCLDSVCQAPRCDDDVFNGLETDADCGGPCAPRADELKCIDSGDCISKVCTSDGQIKKCAIPTCQDAVQNGTELGIDCGNECSSCSCVGSAVIDIQAPGRYDGNTIGAYSFENAGCGTSGDAPEVVHRLQVAERGVFCASTAGSEVDTLLYVREVCDDSTSEVACNDAADYPKVLTSEVEFVADPGKPLYLVVDGYSGEHGTDRPNTGPYSLVLTHGRCGARPLCQGDGECSTGFACGPDGLCVEEPIPCEGFGQCPLDFRCQAQRCVSVLVPCNDDQMCGPVNRCSNGQCVDPPPVGSCAPGAIVAIQPGGLYQGSTVGAEATNEDNTCAGANVLSPEVAHVFMPQDVGEHCAVIENSDFPAFLYARFGCQQPFGSGCVNAQDRLSFFGAPGQETYLFVDGADGANGAESGTYSIRVTSGACPDCFDSSECETGLVCSQGRCLVAPEPGSVVVTEIVIHPDNGLSPEDGQWVELTNPTGGLVNLAGCRVQMGARSSSLDGVVIPASGTVLLARNVNAERNGGVEGATQLAMPLHRATSFAIQCNDVIIDEVDFGQFGDDDFPEGAWSLSGDLTAADLNDQVAAWCPSGGTPNLMNGTCNRCHVGACGDQPEPRCDGDFRVTSSFSCTTVLGQVAPNCLLQEQRIACANEGICRNAICIRRPSAGDVVITELMVAPHSVAESVGEWIELHNPTTEIMNLDNCSLSDRRLENKIDDVTISPGGYIVFARSLDLGINGGVNAVGTFTFALNNQGDEIRLTCGDVLIDGVAYTSGDGFPEMAGRSLALDPMHLTAHGNDIGESWCGGVVAIGPNNPDKASPGAANPGCDVCNPNPCVTPPDSVCSGLDVASFSEPSRCTVFDGQPICAYTETVSTCPQGSICEDGACRPDERGCRAGGCAAGRICNPDSNQCQDAPPAGTCVAPTMIHWEPEQEPMLRLDGSTENAQRAVVDSTCGGGATGPEAVFVWTAETDRDICLSTVGGVQSFDTVLYVRTECAEPFSEVGSPVGYGCNDDVGDWDNNGQCDLGEGGCGLESEMTLRAQTGETYFMIVDGDGADARGPFVLHLSDGPCVDAPLPRECLQHIDCGDQRACLTGLCEPMPPAAAACEADAIIELDGPGTYRGTTIGRPFGLATSECGDTDLAPEAVHRIRFETNTKVCVKTEGSVLDTVISVRRGICTGNEEACSDDIAPGFSTSSRMEFFAAANSDYFIIVESPNLAQPNEGEYVLQIHEGSCAQMPGSCADQGNCPGSCQEPTVVTTFSEYELTTEGASTGIDSAACAEVKGPEAVFRIDLPYSGPVCINTAGSDPGYDLVLHTRRFCERSDSAEVCLDNLDDSQERLELDLDAADSPYLFVDSWNLSGGRVVLSVSEGNCPVCDVDADCPVGRVCQDGLCVECFIDADCEAGLVCSRGQCVFPPCNTDVDCLAGSICQGEQCVPGERVSCDADAVITLNGLGTVNGSTIGARRNLDSGCAATGASPEKVHRLRFDQNQTVCIETTGSDFDTVAYVRTDCPREQGEPCNDDILGGAAVTSSFTLNILANLDYYIIVDGKDGENGESRSGDYTLRVSAGACPDCADDNECSDGRVCEAARCVACRDDDGCPAGFTCQANRCVEPAQVCDALNSCRPDDLFFGRLGQECDLSLGDNADQGLCVDQGMCRAPTPYQIGKSVTGSNVGRPSIYTATCGGRGPGAEHIYAFEAPADGIACFTIVRADFDVVLSLKDECATNPAAFLSGFLECEDVAGNEVEDNRDDRLSYNLEAGRIYYVVVDSNEPDNEGEFTLFSNYGQCGAVPPPACQVDSDCQLGQTCNDQRQCFSPIGTCESPVDIQTLGTYNLRMATASNNHNPSSASCEECVNPTGGNCGEAVYRLIRDEAGPVCVSTEGSSFDTVLYVRTVCNGGADTCNDDVQEGVSWSRMTVNAQANRPYYVFADAWGRSGRLRLTVTEGACQ